MEWLRKKTLYAVPNLNSIAHQSFMPPSTVQTYFEGTGFTRFNDIISAVFYPDRFRVWTDDVLRYCILVFYTVLEVGKGRFIEHFTSW
jgi:hypothetical protein